jgi:nicotinamidase-related amidase
MKNAALGIILALIFLIPTAGRAHQPPDAAAAQPAIEQSEPHNRPQKQALLVMDVQDPMVKMVKDGPRFVELLSKAIEHAREKNIPVIYVVVGFRKGYPEVSPENKSFSMIGKNKSFSFDTEEAARVYSSIAPKPGDVVVTKRRVSAFTGSDLEVVLRSLGIRRLTLAGIATSGVVLSTVREAADKDYGLTVLSDGCADGDEEVHRVLMTKVFPRQADVMTIEEWGASDR